MPPNICVNSSLGHQEQRGWPQAGSAELQPGQALLDRARRQAGDGTECFTILQCWEGCPCRRTGEMCSSSEDVQHTYVVLYVSDFPTLLAHPSCPHIYLPPPRLGPLPRRKAIFVLASHGRRYKSADGWSRSAPVCSPEADVAAGAKRHVSISSGSSRLGRLYLMLLLVQARRCFRGFAKLVCLLAKPKFPNGNPGLLPSDVVL